MDYIKNWLDQNEITKISHRNLSYMLDKMREKDKEKEIPPCEDILKYISKEWKSTIEPDYDGNGRGGDIIYENIVNDNIVNDIIVNDIFVNDNIVNNIISYDIFVNDINLKNQ